jgi:hypothetical protein
VLEIRRIEVTGKLGQKVSKTPISTNKKLSIMAHVSHSSNAGSINRRNAVQADSGIKIRPYSKNRKSGKGYWAWLKW